MKQLKRISRDSTTKQIVDVFQSDLKAGRLKIGDKLPSEVELAKMLGIGRSSLREALRVLSVYGIVEARHGEGTFIVDNRAKNFFEMIGFEYNPETMAEFIKFREIIEVGNIVSICGKLKKEQFDELEEYLKVFEDKKPHRVDEYILADIQFHSKLISYSKNKMLIYVNDMISGFRSELLSKIFEYSDVVEDARRAHRHIFEALRKNDLKECISAVINHIDTTLHHVDEEYRITR